MIGHGAKYYPTNRRTLGAVEVHRLYRMREQIEEVIRVCKDQLGLSGCQARAERAQPHYVIYCLVAFYTLERESDEREHSICKLKCHLSFQGYSLALSALDRLKRTT